MALRLAQPYPVDDAGMVQRIGNDRVFRPQKRLEQTGICVKSRSVKDTVLLAQKPRDPRFKLFMFFLCTADKPDRGHAETIAIQPRMRGGNDLGIVGKPEVIVGTKVDHLASVGQ